MPNDAPGIDPTVGGGSGAVPAPVTPQAPAAPTSAAAPAAAPTTPAPAAAPAAIEYTFELPEGVTMDPGLMDRFTAHAKELNLPADKAQALVSMGAEAVAAQMNALKEADAARRAEWADQATADKEFGGPKLAENLATAKLAVKELAPELAGFLDETGLGNHPEMIRFALKAGKLLKADGYVQGRANPDGGGDANRPMDAGAIQQRAAQRFYGSPAKA